MGQVSSGGDKKAAWLGQPDITFKCQALEEFLTKYRVFFRDYLERTSKPGDQVSEQSLEDFRSRIEDHIHELFSYFDSVLDDEDADWEDDETKGRPKRPRPRAIEKALGRAVRKSIGNGLWRGASRWKGRGVVPEKGHLIKEMLRKVEHTHESISMGQRAHNASQLTAIRTHKESVSSTPRNARPVPKQTLSRRRVAVRTVAKSDRVLRPRLVTRK